VKLPEQTSLQAMEGLANTLDDAVQLLRDFSGNSEVVTVKNVAPASLLEQCLRLCEQHQAAPVEPVRTVHHFACTGGTLISKCIAAMPNTQVLSEVDPLSTLHKTGEPVFGPTDLIQLVRQSTRGADTRLLVDMFLSNLEIIQSASVKAGQRLVLRDHAHSHYCAGPKIHDRPTFKDIVATRFSVRSVVTVRDPVDSFLSLKGHRWFHFQPWSFDEYCRRYLAFLHAYEDIPVVKFEAFSHSPQEVMSQICEQLGLTYSDDFPDLFNVFALTGDSGRKSDVIEDRPRKAIDAELMEEMAHSMHYHRLRAVLGYE
jgi:hypothetical protein